MVPAEVAEALAAELISIVEGVDPATCRAEQNLFCVGELVPLPLEGVASSVNRVSDLELQDESGVTVGTLCFTSQKRGAVPSSLTAWQYAAYLSEVELVDAGQPYDFQRDYVVINASFVEKYLDEYWDGAPIWGGFTHSPLPSRLAAPVVTSCRMVPALVLPTPYHKQALNRYVEASNSFDRFLKLYHSIELLFDFAIMRQMQGIQDDLAGFQKLISSYSSKEVDRLRHIIDEFCDDPSSLAQKLEPVAQFSTRAHDVFMLHSKEGNPLKAAPAWHKFNALAAAGQLSETDIRAAKELGDKRSDYKSFMASIAAYWIYRVRSSIAHHRVGEFIFVDSDEDFMVHFAEPLMLEVVRQVFAGQKMSQIA